MTSERHDRARGRRLVILVAWAAAAAFAITGSRRRRAGGVAFAVGALMVPSFVPADVPVVRAALALGAVSIGARAVDLARCRSTTTFWARFAHVTSLVDHRQLRRATPTLDRRALVVAVGYGALGAVGLTAVALAAMLTASEAARALRWGGGALAVYALTDASFSLLVVGYRAGGFVPPPLHRQPIASRTISEFWAARWNLTVSACCAPTSSSRWRSEAGLPLVSPRLLSAVRSRTPTSPASPRGPALGPRWVRFSSSKAHSCSSNGALGVRRWPAGVARTCTIGVMLATSPLFVEPFLRAIGFKP